MDKLSFDLEDLRVESFETTVAGVPRAGGTVYGYAWSDATECGQTCHQDWTCGSCDNTAGDTCYAAGCGEISNHDTCPVEHPECWDASGRETCEGYADDSSCGTCDGEQCIE